MPLRAKKTWWADGSESGKGGRTRGLRGRSMAGSRVGSALATSRPRTPPARRSPSGSTHALTPPSSASATRAQTSEPRSQLAPGDVERAPPHGPTMGEPPAVRQDPVGPLHLPVHLRTEEIEDALLARDAVGEHVLHEELAGRAGGEALVVGRLGEIGDVALRQPEVHRHGRAFAHQRREGEEDRKSTR